nr:MAG TPA: hypothetical protein [Caudoviricetes sp.]
MKNEKYKFSDFSVKIQDRDNSIKVIVSCFADNGSDAPFIVYRTALIARSEIFHLKFVFSELSFIITECINDILTADITPPNRCECQDQNWFKSHPNDRQEYWRTKEGRIYPKTHTVKCPNNPTNRKNN